MKNPIGSIMIYCCILTLIFVGIIAIENRDKIKTLKSDIKTLQSDIKISRDREDKLYTAIQQVEYAQDVLTDYIKDKK